MNQEPPILSEPKRSPARVLLWTSLAMIGAILSCAVVLILARLGRQEAHLPPATTQEGAAPTTNALPTESQPEMVPDLPPPPPDFSKTNTVSIRLGQEGPEDGLRHLAKEADGRTTIETLDGVPCRYLNRKASNKSFGYIYFVIDPTFKRNERMPARIEVEYYLSSPGHLRLQYDAMEGERHRAYKSVIATNADFVTWGPGIQYTRIRGTNAWQTATFHLPDGAFLNSQNGGAAFRLEVTPADLSARRVSVTREEVPGPPPPSR
jgi:hypothetical protein